MYSVSEIPEFKAEPQYHALSAPALLAFRAKMPLTNKTKPQPLPPCPGSFPLGSDLWKAYQVCKDLESSDHWRLFDTELGHPRSADILLDLTPARASGVLGFALLYSPSASGRNNLAEEILGCNDDHEQLAGLAHLYLYGLIGVCTLSVASCLLSC
jgi:hypothetical protein